VAERGVRLYCCRARGFRRERDLRYGKYIIIKILCLSYTYIYYISCIMIMVCTEGKTQFGHASYHTNIVHKYIMFKIYYNVLYL